MSIKHTHTQHFGVRESIYCSTRSEVSEREREMQGFVAGQIALMKLLTEDSSILMLDT